MRSALALACLGLGLCACASQQSLPPAEQSALRAALLPALQYNIGGKRYGVGRLSGRPGEFEVYTGDGSPGSRKDMARALRYAYGCQSMSFTEIEAPWRRARARGTFCGGSQSPYGR